MWKRWYQRTVFIHCGVELVKLGVKPKVLSSPIYEFSFLRFALSKLKFFIFYYHTASPLQYDFTTYKQVRVEATIDSYRFCLFVYPASPYFWFSNSLVTVHNI